MPLVEILKEVGFEQVGTITDYRGVDLQEKIARGEVRLYPPAEETTVEPAAQPEAPQPEAPVETLVEEPKTEEPAPETPEEKLEKIEEEIQEVKAEVEGN